VRFLTTSFLAILTMYIRLPIAQTMSQEGLCHLVTKAFKQQISQAINKLLNNTLKSTVLAIDKIVYAILILRKYITRVKTLESTKIAILLK